MELTLNPEDNLRLANLCGALDENLKQIEDALDVGIARRGAIFQISGEKHQTELAAQLIEDFYERAKKTHRAGRDTVGAGGNRQAYP